jgi:HSP20 family protein
MDINQSNPQLTNPQRQELENWRSRLMQNEETTSRFWAPVVDVSESKEEIVLEAELPGMKKDEIDIQLNGDTLTLRGERQFEQAQKNEQYHRIERQYGAWQRSFQIEVPIDASRVSADYEQGVLTVRLPKSESLKPRQIEIQTNSSRP